MGQLGNVLKFGDFSSGAVIQLFTMNSLRNPNSPVALQPGIILRRQRQLLLRIFHQPLTHTRLLIRIQPHALFCATPKGIVGAADPFVIHRVFQFRFVELMTEILPEVAYRPALPSSSSLLLPYVRA